MSVERVDCSFLESLVGYNVRRASLFIINVFLQRMAVHGLRPVDFSVLSLVHRNPGITSRQICTALGLLPPNLVSMIGALEKRQLLRRARHSADGRAMSLYLTDEGAALTRAAETSANQLEIDATSGLNEAERGQLKGLLQKIYR